MNIRTRILKSHINCIPWRGYWKGEIELLPISSQTLFSKNGQSLDQLEISLRMEGYLLETENLLELLTDPENLKRKKIDELEDSNYGLMPDDWTEEDYEYHKCRR